MVKTANDVCTYALRKMGVVGVGLTPESEDFALAKEAYQGVLDEVNEIHGRTPWTIDTAPDAMFLPLADLVANEISTTYPQKAGLAPSRTRALARLRAYLHPNDLPDPRDADGNGFVSAGEAEAGKRAAYY